MISAASIILVLPLVNVNTVSNSQPVTIAKDHGLCYCDPMRYNDGYSY